MTVCPVVGCSAGLGEDVEHGRHRRVAEDRLGGRDGGARRERRPSSNDRPAALSALGQIPGVVTYRCLTAGVSAEVNAGVSSDEDPNSSADGIDLAAELKKRAPAAGD